MSKHTLKLTFPDEDTKRYFANWLSDGGENAFDAHLAIIAPDWPTLYFNYWGPEQRTKSGKRKYGKFLCDNIIRITEVKS